MNFSNITTGLQNSRIEKLLEFFLNSWNPISKKIYEVPEKFLYLEIDPDSMIVLNSQMDFAFLVQISKWMPLKGISTNSKTLCSFNILENHYILSLGNILELSWNFSYGHRDGENVFRIPEMKCSWSTLLSCDVVPISVYGSPFSQFPELMIQKRWYQIWDSHLQEK